MKYVNISQLLAGHSFKTLQDLEQIAISMNRKPEDYLKISDEMIKPFWGSGTFELHDDNTIGKCVADHWDSSD